MSKKSRARAADKAATSAKASAASCVVRPPEPNTFFVRWRTLLAGGIVVLAALAAFYNSFSGPFILDDPLAVRDNPSIRHWGSALSPSPDATTEGRPLLN